MLDLTKRPDIVKSDYAGERSIVLIPNITAGDYLHDHYDGLQYFEERYLYFLAYLKQPNTQLVAVLSEGVEPAFLEYLLSHTAQLSGCSVEDLEKRISYVWVPITDEKVVTRELVKRPDILEQISSAITHPEYAYIEFFRTTKVAVEVAKKLQLPWYGLPENAMYVNDKTGSKEVFGRAAIPHVPGFAASTLTEAYEILKRLCNEAEYESFLIKINDGGGGVGITRIYPKQVEESFESFRESIVLLPGEEIDFFERSIEQDGCIVEPFIDAPITTSPSVQFEVFPDGEAVNRATHDQIIVDKTVYDGIRFPADEFYREQVIAMGDKIVAEIKNAGGIGFMAIDLLATKQQESDEWKLWAIEINARKGGTNHTYMWAKLLTDAKYDTEKGMLVCDKGEVCYRGTESFIKKDELKNIDPSEFIKKLRESGLDYNHETESGVMIHMLTPLRHFGKFGCTVIGRTHEEVDTYWEKLHDFVERLV